MKTYSQPTSPGRRNQFVHGQISDKQPVAGCKSESIFDHWPPVYLASGCPGTATMERLRFAKIGADEEILSDCGVFAVPIFRRVARLGVDSAP